MHTIRPFSPLWGGGGQCKRSAPPPKISYILVQLTNWGIFMDFWQKFCLQDDISNESKRNISDIGFIAQEIEELIPEAVSEHIDIKTGVIYKNIKYERIIPHLLNVIQSLLSKI